MARQGAYSNAGFCSNGEKKSTSHVQQLGNATFHDFLGIKTKDASVLLAAETLDVSFSEASTPPSALASSSGGRGLLCTASDLASENQVGDYLQGVPFYSPRNDISGPENGDRIAGIKRRNPDSAFMGSYRNQIPHIPQNGAGGDRPRYNNKEGVYNMQPPRIASSSLTQHSLGTRFNPSVSKWERPISSNMSSAPNSPLGSQFVPHAHQAASNSSREFNVAPARISHSAADEGSRTGIKSPGLLSSFNAGHDGRHSSQILLSCDKQKTKTEGLAYKSSNHPSQQGLDSNDRQMTIFYGGQAHVFNDVHPDKADIIMALAGSNGGSWSTTLASKLNVTGISNDPESAKEYHGKLYHSLISTSQGVGDTPISTQAAAGDHLCNIVTKETREPVRATESNAEQKKES